MLNDPLDLLPQDRREQAERGLAAAFGRSSITALTAITTGASAQSYRVDVAGRPYLLRLESPRRDPLRAYACMRLAVEAGIAPAAHHADPGSGVAITDFVVHRPLADYAGGGAALRRALGALIARLQASPLFPPFLAYPDVVGQLFTSLLDSGMYAPGLLEAHRQGFERIREAYSWDSSALVSSHNDLNPHNVLYDGERLWLIDWETAYANDPLVDVATLLLFFADAPGQDTDVLQSWLGRELDRRERARLVLAGLLVRLFYGCAASLNAAHGQKPVMAETNLVAPTREQFFALLEQKQWGAGSPEAQRLVGKMALGGFMGGLTSSEFEEALAICRRG
ncbi:Phosphotransferase enzyme family protein [Rhodospirillales bacterium URHD0017]|nr:Phosphotransferase enzyme family protein [Rhodospirillales bacterium URHD0017]